MALFEQVITPVALAVSEGGVMLTLAATCAVFEHPLAGLNTVNV